MTELRKQLWVIDNDPYFLARLRIAASVIDWEVVQLDSAKPDRLPEDGPELILLDRELSGNAHESKVLLEQWLHILSEYKQCCYLITHNREDKGRRLVEENELAGLLIKPLDVERIGEWALLAKQSDEDTTVFSELQDGQGYWQEYIKAINVPTIVLDQDLHLVAQNTAGLSASIFSEYIPEAGAAPNAEARRMLNMMLRELEPPNQDKAETDCAIRCEWDAKNKQWREWRLRSYPDKFAPGKYILTFVTYSQAAKHMMPLSQASHYILSDYMDALAKHLAELWGITRVRLYRVEELAGQNAGDEPIDHLLLPMLQFGGGLTDGKDSWLQNAQLLSENSYAQVLLSAAKGKLVVHENNSAKGFPGVGFAKSTTRANMLIRDSDGLLVGMISCDRRFDHFESKREWQDDDNRHARLAMQFVSDLGELKENEAGRMQGLFNLVHDHLAQILTRLTDERLSAWQRKISFIFTKKIDELLRDQAEISHGHYKHKLAAVRKAFGELLSAWQLGQSNLSDADPFAERRGIQQTEISYRENCYPPSQLDSIYIADFTVSPSSFSSELGVGDVWRLRNKHSLYWRAMPPHSDAISIDNFCALVEQNFQEFNLEQRQGSQREGNSIDIELSTDTPLDKFLTGLQRYGLKGAELEKARDLLRAIGGWAAVKIPQTVGYPWLLVAVGKRNNSWTRERVRWLQVLAERMTMLLRWWQAESQREWYQGAMAHELSKPMQYLEVSIRTCHEDSKDGKFGQQLEDMQSLVQYHQHLVANIHTIADGGTSYASSSSGLAQTSTTLREEWQRCDWARRYCSAIDFSAISEPIPAVQLSLPPSVLAQSMIILLINAHRYHYRPVEVLAQAELELSDSQIIFRTRNAVVKPIPAHSYQNIFLPFFKLRGDVSGGLGIGLAVLDALSKRYVMNLDVRDEPSGKDGWCWQIFELHINRSKP